MNDESFIREKEDSIALQVFTVSSGLIGVCITIIGIINLISSSKKIETIADDVACLDALVFLTACISSYIAMKIHDKGSRFQMEKIIDGVFLFGLILLAVVGVLIVYNINHF